MIINNKFEMGQKVYYIVCLGNSSYVACEGYITKIIIDKYFMIDYKINDFNVLYTEQQLFKTKEQAEEEIKNEFC